MILKHFIHKFMKWHYLGWYGKRIGLQFPVSVQYNSMDLVSVTGVWSNETKVQCCVRLYGHNGGLNVIGMNLSGFNVMDLFSVFGTFQCLLKIAFP